MCIIYIYIYKFLFNKECSPPPSTPELLPVPDGGSDLCSVGSATRYP